MIFVNISDKGFTVTGHSGYADAGQDIVCAAVSSAAELTANALTEIVGVQCDIEVDADKPLLSVEVKNNDKAELCRMFIKAFELQIEGIAESYPEYLTIKKSEV